VLRSSTVPICDYDAAKPWSERSAIDGSMVVVDYALPAVTDVCYNNPQTDELVTELSNSIPFIRLGLTQVETSSMDVS
jgi:hypothetical protein